MSPNLFDFILLSFSVVNLVTGICAFKKDKIHPKKKKEWPYVTVIARTWDDDHIVERFIKNVLSQNYKGKLQLIIADDKSKDNTEKICKKYKKKITYVKAKKHHEKKAVFLNKVIKKYAKGEIIVNTDIDAVMSMDWITNLVEHFDDREVKAMCGPAYSGNQNNWLSKIRTIEDFWLFSAGMWGRYSMTGTAATYGSNHAIRMKTLKEIGYYGTKTLTEDAELTAKLWEKGHKISMCREAYVLVESVDNFDSFIRERKRWVSGTFEAGLNYGSKKRFFSSLLFAINALSGFFSLIGFFSNYPITIFLMNSLAVALAMMAFRAKNHLLAWVPVFIIMGTVLNIIAILYSAKDKFFGKGITWTKVEGEHYHKGIGLSPPLEE